MLSPQERVDDQLANVLGTIRNNGSRSSKVYGSLLVVNDVGQAHRQASNKVKIVAGDFDVIFAKIDQVFMLGKYQDGSIVPVEHRRWRRIN